jgi:uncharacterized protein YjiS (DUF1127 family)
MDRDADPPGNAAAAAQPEPKRCDKLRAKPALRKIRVHRIELQRERQGSVDGLVRSHGGFAERWFRLGHRFRCRRRICLRPWHALREWRARERDHFDFGLLNEYEVDRLAKDIGLSRSELLGADLRVDGLQFLPHPNRYAAIVDLGGGNASVIGEGPLRAVAPQACGLSSLDGPLPPPAS